MNPTKLIAESVTHEFPALVEIASTDWFNAAKKEPGQPGTFEVNPVAEFDGEDACRRFAYYNGKTFGPIKGTPEAAYAARFDKSALGDTIAAFRGLVEEA